MKDGNNNLDRSFKKLLLESYEKKVNDSESLGDLNLESFGLN